MGNMYEQFETDEKLETEGAWVAYGDGIEFLVLAENSPKLRALARRHQKQYKSYFLTGEVPETVERQLEIDRASTAIANWRGENVTDREGTPLPYNAANARQVMTDLHHMRRAVLLTMNTREAYRREATKELGKHSAPVSPRKSATVKGATTSSTPS